MKSVVRKKESKAISELRAVLEPTLSDTVKESVLATARVNPPMSNNMWMYMPFLALDKAAAYASKFIYRWNLESFLANCYGPTTKNYKLENMVTMYSQVKALRYSCSRLVAEHFNKLEKKFPSEILMGMVSPYHFELLMASLAKRKDPAKKEDLLKQVVDSGILNRVSNATELRLLLAKLPMLYKYIDTIEKMQASKMTVSQHILWISRNEKLKCYEYISKELFAQMENVCMLEVMISTANNSKQLLAALTKTKATFNEYYSRQLAQN